MSLLLGRRSSLGPHKAGGAIDPINYRPNDGSGVWPDSSNTGYLREPNWPGSFTGGTVGTDPSGNTNINPADGTTILYTHFTGKVSISPTSGDNITFVGCLFECSLGSGTGDWCCYVYCPTKVTFKYCTWKPSAYSTPPGYVSGSSASTTNAVSVEYGASHVNSFEGPVNQMSNCQIIMDRCEWWGCGGGCQFGGGGTASNPHTFTNNYIHDYADPWGLSGVTNTYHHDGIGPDSNGLDGYIYINHNTIASMGNTNAIALQGAAYNNVTVTNNYLSGWGLQLSIGASGNAANDTNCTITDNVTSGEVINVNNSAYAGIGLGGNSACSPNYDFTMAGTTNGNTWRRNRWQVRSGDPDYPLVNNGQYWWPTDNNPHATDYTG